MSITRKILRRSLLIALCIFGTYVNAELIFEKLPTRLIYEPDYSKISTVTYNLSAPKQWQFDIASMLNELALKSIRVISTGKDSFDINAVLSPITIHISIQEIPQDQLLLTLDTSIDGQTSNGFNP